MECVDEFGINHKILFTCCACEPLAVTLTRANLWPATPTNPRFAFSFALLDLAEALLLECQVAMKDFCNALKFRNPFPKLKGREFYNSFIHSFEEYRFAKHQTRNMNFHNNTLDQGNVCPACPQGSGKVIVAMDALFGLPRKKSAGISYQSPLYGDVVFLDQNAVDQYVSDYSKLQHLNTDCNDFLAGSIMRSANRYKRLDETAVFGYCCRHEFPGKFINLKHGEKLSYGVWLLEQIIASSKSNGQQLYVMYDIACSLSQHLKQQKRSDVLDEVTLCLPTFHSYGHKVSCQVTYGPRRCNGLGTSDVERLWSYLRSFSRMTKEMRASHRTDVLTSALLFYGYKTIRKQAKLLLSRYKKATKTMEVAEEVLDRSNFPFDDIEKWLADELEACNFKFLKAKPPQWKTKYFQILQLYYSLKDQLACGSGDQVVAEQLSRIDSHLEELERKHSISRWVPSESEYVELQCALYAEKKDRVLLELWRVSQQRLFLLKLKKKYADGQKIAIKLSKQIGKETKLLKSLVQDYCACLSHEDSASTITMDEVLDPVKLEDRLQALGVWCLGTVPEKREAMNAYLMLCRSKEEKVMLKQELESFVSYHRAKKDLIVQSCYKVHSHLDDRYSRGISALLYRLLQDFVELLEEAQLIVNSMDEYDDDEFEWCDSDIVDSDSDDN